MNKEKLFNRFSEILDNIIDNYNGEQFYDRLIYGDFWYWHDNYGHRFIRDNEGISFEAGASRVVIIDDDLDYVCKINQLSVEYDYCEVEADLYQIAKSEGLEDYFAEMVFLGLYEHPIHDEISLPLYAMERFDVNEDDVFTGSYEYGKRLGLSDDEITERDDEVQDCVRFCYGDEVAEKIDNFIFERDINDLHTSNVGFDINGNIKFIDYCGWGG